MPKQKLTHEIEWEPVTGAYRILKITGSQRQPTMAEAQEYLYQNHLPEEIWVAGFYHSGEWDDWTESRTLAFAAEKEKLRVFPSPATFAAPIMQSVSSSANTLPVSLSTIVM